MVFPPNPIIRTFNHHDNQKTNPSSSSPLVFRFSSLEYCNYLNHGVFSRRGGKSRSPYDSLNTSFQTGDSPEHVKANLELIQGIMKADQVFFSRQVHDRHILIFDQAPPNKTMSRIEADAFITTIPNLALMVKLADCQGTILFDPKRHVLALVHCGWRGHVKNIYGHVVERMTEKFHCHPADIYAAISPSLGPCCAEFKTYQELFPESFLDFMEREAYFNLWELGKQQLVEAGLARLNIETANICTKCRSDLFYSYRGEAKTGRFAIVAMLREDKK
jgi:YfiH family protein